MEKSIVQGRGNRNCKIDYIAPLLNSQVFGLTQNAVHKTRVPVLGPDKLSQYLPALTGLRFLLGMWVILHHLTGKHMLLDQWNQSLPLAVQSILRGGYLAVQIFLSVVGFRAGAELRQHAMEQAEPGAVRGCAFCPDLSRLSSKSRAGVLVCLRICFEAGSKRGAENRGAGRLCVRSAGLDRVLSRWAGIRRPGRFPANFSFICVSRCCFCGWAGADWRGTCSAMTAVLCYSYSAGARRCSRCLETDSSSVGFYSGHRCRPDL